MLRRLVLLLIVTVSLTASAGTSAADTCRTIPRRVASIGGALVINASLTEILKHSIHELRPDRNGNNSFPSRHTSWAFTASTVISNELHTHSPWWSLGAQACATAVGFQRVAASRHYAGDVLAGAALGTISTELAYVISSRIWRGKCTATLYDNDFRPSFSIGTEGLFMSGSHYCTAFGTSAAFRLPLSDHYGFGARLSAAAIPVKDMQHAFTDISLTAGAVCHYTFCTAYAFEGSIEIGFGRHSKISDTRGSGFEFQAIAEPAVSRRITENMAVRAALPIHLGTMPRSAATIGISISSVVVF